MTARHDPPGRSWLLEEGLLEDCADLPSERDWSMSLEPPDDSVYTRMARSTPVLLVVHHSATRTGCCPAFRALHRSVFGWKDIGYHYVIGNGTLSGDGEVEPGRPRWAEGAHARGWNDRTIGICLVGNFELGRPGARQLRSLSDLLTSLMSGYGLQPSSIALHREVPGMRTACPGRFFTLGLLERLLR